MQAALDRKRGFFSCKRRKTQGRCKKVCRAAGRRLRDFLFAVSIFFVKEKKRSCVKNEVVGYRFRKMKKVFRFCFCCWEVGLGCRGQNNFQTDLRTHLSLK